MTLLIALLPVYLLGNLHCLGMCGPLVMFIGQHRFRYAYFLGRCLSFTLAGTLAGGLGAILQVLFDKIHLPALTCFLFGTLLLFMGMGYLFRWRFKTNSSLNQLMSRWSQQAARLLSKDQFWAVFLFGACTILLPCGQTLMVFSACALSESATVGAINGLAFALLTSPSLLFAMKAKALLQAAKKYYNTLIGVFSLLVGVLAICRGFAQLDLIPHWILNPTASESMHIVLF